MPSAVTSCVFFEPAAPKLVCSQNAANGTKFIKSFTMALPEIQEAVGRTCRVSTFPPYVLVSHVPASALDPLVVANRRSALSAGRATAFL